MANPADSPVPSLSLLKALHPSASGPTRSWQSASHPDPSTPLLATASADKTVNVWSLRDFSLVSTISGGHKRSVRAVDWKDFGRAARGPRSERKPVVLGTGSFDANVGVWVWNEDRRWARFKDVEDEESGQGKQNTQVQARDGVDKNKNSNATAGDDSAMTDDLATDLTNEEQDQDEEDEEWHFATLLTGPDSEIKSIAFAPPHYPANWLATSSRDKSVWIWEEVEPEEWETIAVLSEHTGDVKCVSWCAGARRGNTSSSGRKAKRRKLVNGAGNDGDVNMASEDSHVNGAAAADASYPGGEEGGNEEDDEEDKILGSRDILASGSYDDTIRLWRDVEEEGDWICVGVIDDHKGTVWDIKWEPHINYSTLDLSSQQNQTQETAQSLKDRKAIVEEFENDWEPRLISCSDDLTVRVFRRELSDAEKARKQQSRTQQASSLTSAVPTGFASSRLPSVIRPMSSMERWTVEAILPEVHVRSVYAVDWSRNTGLVVSCGGDGTVAVYKEVPVVGNDEASAPLPGEEDVVMNGTTPHLDTETGEGAVPAAGAEPYKLHKTKWTVVALLESAHDEYEINHVCWAVRRDKDRRFDGEEVVVSTGDEGDVRIWTLPDGVLDGN
jgi:WD40 repeat protein